MANTDPAKSADSRISQFDGLRAWAIVGVFISHYLMAHRDWLLVRLDPGYYAVRLFFVLSGFLITGILLRQKAQIESSQTTLGGALALFYLRRILRLSPPYYLIIIVGAFLFEPIQQHLFSFLFYAQNYLFVLHSETFRSAIGHLWSLAVEEQFYAVWPLVIFLCPPRILPAFVACTAVAGCAFGLAISAVGGSHHTVAMLTPTNLATLGTGALAAVLRSKRYGNELLADKLSRLGLLAGPPLLLAAFALDNLHLAYRLVLPIREAGCALFFSWMIGRLRMGVPWPARWGLLSRPAVYVGTISYAAYLFHMPLIDLFDKRLLPALGLNPPGGWLRLVAYGGCAIGLASASWWLLESRVSRLKDRILKYAN